MWNRYEICTWTAVRLFQERDYRLSLLNVAGMAVAIGSGTTSDILERAARRMERLAMLDTCPGGEAGDDGQAEAASRTRV